MIYLRGNNMNLPLKLKQSTNHVSKYTVRPMDPMGGLQHPALSLTKVLNLVSHTTSHAYDTSTE